MLCCTHRPPESGPTSLSGPAAPDVPLYIRIYAQKDVLGMFFIDFQVCGGVFVWYARDGPDKVVGPGVGIPDPCPDNMLLFVCVMSQNSL